MANRGVSVDWLHSAVRILPYFKDKDVPSEPEICLPGTGFFLSDRNANVHIITNRHVLDPSYSDPRYKNHQLSKLCVIISRKSEESGRPSRKAFLLMNQDTHFHQSLANDVAMIKKPKMIEMPLDANKGGAINIDYNINFEMVCREEELEKDMVPSDFVVFPGYPSQIDSDYEYPIMRTGTISSDPRIDFHFGNSIQGQCVAYEAFSVGGLSGSPVFATQKGIQGNGFTDSGYRRPMLVGINAGHLDSSNTHSGLSYFYKSSTILDLLGA